MPFFKFTNQLVLNCLVLFSLIILSSCGSRKDIVFYQNSDNTKEMNSSFESKFKADDLLRIFINTTDTEAAQAFNLAVIANLGSQGGVGQINYQTYLVDNNGFIEFPILGKLKVEGLTRTGLIDFLKVQLKPYLKSDPVINITILNFRIAITGEVARPGSFIINSERVTLPDALALAGDLTIFGKRTNIIVLRDVNGVKTINRLDLTKTDFINSEFFYLTQNDVIYVEPNKTRINASAIGPNASVIISGLSLLITIVALLSR
jgi:polysaccharide export outer membrane protein